MTDVQKQKVAEWIQQGLKLSEIQTRLDSEFGVRMTYMEVKMLLSDLELKPKDQEQARPAPPLAAASEASPMDPKSDSPPGTPPGLLPEPAEDQLEADPSLAGSASNVSVSMDTVTRPGALVSGKVTFSDKKTAEWYLDQFGRLGLAPSEKGYRPSEPDVVAFQTQLQTQLAKLGM